MCNLSTATCTVTCAHVAHVIEQISIVQLLLVLFTVVMTLFALAFDKLLKSAVTAFCEKENSCSYRVLSKNCKISH